MAQREVLLARPRGMCAGVKRAIETVDRALELYPGTIYVLHEIVHNPQVVDGFRDRGVVFVESLNLVPAGGIVIFSAHGVSDEVVAEAAQRGLVTIDATCPLVTKVHLAVMRHARAGREVVMIGHRGHPEVTGTLGRYDRSFGGDAYLVETLADVEALQVRNPESLAVVTQTTLSLNDTRQLMDAMLRRFPKLLRPSQGDICYATQNRQNAVLQMAGQIAVLIVAGGRNSSNTTRLRELGARIGVPAYLVQDATELDSRWLPQGDGGVSQAVGVTAGASTPDSVVRELLARLADLGWDTFHELPGKSEPISFRLPAELGKGPKAAGQTLAPPLGIEA
jgi:4-hydroxy-3-methylbut-2-en-1-yl diphosphate reductase